MTLLASLDPKPFLLSSGPKSPRAPAAVSKEQLACADIGIDPNGADFASCVKETAERGARTLLPGLCTETTERLSGTRFRASHFVI